MKKATCLPPKRPLEDNLFISIFFTVSGIHTGNSYIIISYQKIIIPVKRRSKFDVNLRLDSHNNAIA